MSLENTPNPLMNCIVPDPDLGTALGLLKTNIMASLNCVALGTIQSFDSAAQRSSVSINYKKTFFNGAKQKSGDRPYGNAVYRDYPILVECPVVVITGGSSYLNMPITVGDTCIILFNDRDIDNWVSSGQVGPVATQRMHSFTDGLALVGIRSKQNAVAAFDAARAILTDGNAKIGINPGTHKLTAQNNTTSLNTQLQALCTKIESLITAVAAITVSGVTTGPGVSGVPVNAATITALSADISAIGSALGGLLE